MVEQKKIFRSVALERMSSPEQLDQVIQVTTPKGWIALLSVGGLILVALIWGLFGSIPTKVSGMGIIVSGKGIKDITSPTSGRLDTIYIVQGDIVQRGQLVARVYQPELIAQISQMRSKISELENEKEHLQTFEDAQLTLQSDHNAREVSRINNEIMMLKDQLTWLSRRRDNQQTLLDKGLITRQKFLSTQEDMNSVEQKIEQLDNERKQLPINMHRLAEELENQVSNKVFQINEAKRELHHLVQHLEDTSMVFSGYSGRILELTVDEDHTISTGARIASLELVGDYVDELEVILYVPADQGKRIFPGMEARISPSTVRPEEHGIMLGMVTRTGIFPATRSGMLRILGDERLVDTFSAHKPPIEVYVSPIPSPHTYSGFKWSSSQGPDQIIHTGTLAQGSVTVEIQAPIALVLPWFKKNIFGIGQ